MAVLRSGSWSATLFLAIAACEPALVPTTGRGGRGADGNFFVTPDAGPDSAALSGCAQEVHRAKFIPLDLMLLVDTSISMNNSTGAGSKWRAVQGALVGFVRDPRSVGLGVGLQFFPAGKEPVCVTDRECGFPNTNIYCRPRQACLGPGGLVGAASCGGFGNPACAAGTTCTPIGRCDISGADCLTAGQPCSPGGGTCVSLKTCRFSSPNFQCDDAGYQAPAVSIAPLPTNQVDLARTLMNKAPAGGTPMGPAVRGVLSHLQAHLTANPGHKVVLVLASDGFPGSCTMNDIPTIATNLAGAFMATPSIPTYVIGVFAPAELASAQPLMDQLAMGGGTAKSFILTSTPDLTQKLQEALDQIRGAELACEFTIPPAKMGTIDFTRVNVRYTGAGGPDDLLYVESAGKCDPIRGGWYYDVPPSRGTPRRILVCDASCRQFKGDGSAQVDLVFGCATRVIE